MCCLLDLCDKFFVEPPAARSCVVVAEKFVATYLDLLQVV
jgi:hypothetical protein